MTRIKFRYSEIEDEGVLSFDEIIARQSCAIAETFYFLFLFFATSPLAPFGGSSTLARPGSLSLTRTPCARQLGIGFFSAFGLASPQASPTPSAFLLCLFPTATTHTSVVCVYALCYSNYDGLGRWPHSGRDVPRAAF